MAFRSNREERFPTSPYYIALRDYYKQVAISNNFYIALRDYYKQFL